MKATPKISRELVLDILHIKEPNSFVTLSRSPSLGCFAEYLRNPGHVIEGFVLMPFLQGQNHSRMDFKDLRNPRELF